MTQKELSELGITEAVIIDKLVEKLADVYLATDEDYKTDFEKRLEQALIKRVDERIDAALKKHVLPKITEMVDNICLQETNQWGEKRGAKLTFTEYLTQRVDAYIREPVNYDGKPKTGDTWNWSASGTRIQHMIHEHLQYSVSQAMVKALGEVDSSVRKGLEEAVKMALANIKVSVDTKVLSK